MRAASDAWRSTLEQLTGVTIPVGGIVEFYGVAALSSAVGGVDVCVVERDRRRLHGPAPRPPARMPCRAWTRSRSSAPGTASATAATSAASRASRRSSRRSCARCRARGTLGNPVKLYSIAKAVLSNMHALERRCRTRRRSCRSHARCRTSTSSKITFVQYPTAYTDDNTDVVPSESVEAPERRAGRQDLPWTSTPTARRGLRVRHGHRPECAARAALPGGPAARTTLPRHPTATARRRRRSPATVLPAGRDRARRPRKCAAPPRTRADALQDSLRRVLTGCCECASARLGACLHDDRPSRGVGARHGGLSERPMELVLKTSGQQCLVGSNPTPSARHDPQTTEHDSERNRVNERSASQLAPRGEDPFGRATRPSRRRHSAWKTAAKVVGIGGSPSRSSRARPSPPTPPGISRSTREARP